MDNYYLIGKNINYSFSPIIHNYLFSYYQIEAKYEILNINDINEIKKLKYKGLNVTIPYKKQVLELIDKKSFISNEVKKDKSVNTIIDNAFYSTDHYGVEKTLKKVNLEKISNFYILGTGATHDIVKSVLLKFNIKSQNIFSVSRTKSKDVLCYDEIYAIKKKGYMIINCTPMGNSEDSLLSDKFIESANVFFDLGYGLNNGLKKQCLLNNTKYISGLDMLLNQAYKSFEIWTGRYPEEDIQNECKYNLLCRKSSKIIVIGMPFSGKTTMHNYFLKSNKINVVDNDIEIEKLTNISNHEFINVFGIDEFRKKEAEVFGKLLSDEDIDIIFTGGKTLLLEDNYMLLSNQLVINITPEIKELEKRFDNTRANIKNIEKLQEIYYNRIDIYNNVAHINCSYGEAIRIIDENYNN